MKLPLGGEGTPPSPLRGEGTAVIRSGTTYTGMEYLAHSARGETSPLAPSLKNAEVWCTRPSHCLRSTLPPPEEWKVRFSSEDEG